MGHMKGPSSNETAVDSASTDSAFDPAASPLSLYRTVVSADHPERLVELLPAQTVHTMLLDLGFESAVELVHLLAPAKYREVLDFDLWRRDELDEGRFFQWLTVLEQDGGIEACKHFLEQVDPALLSLLVARHVTVHYAEERTEPPGPHFYTPDHGSTWLSIEFENQDHYRMLGKILAILFESDAERFYQLLATSAASTTVEQEELAYHDRCRRLWDLGIPDRELSASVHRPLYRDAIAAQLADAPADPRSWIGGRPVPGLLSGESQLEPLTSVLEELRLHPRAGLTSPQEMADEVAGELAFIVNAAIVYCGVDYSDREQVLHLLGAVRGALNIGLEILSAEIQGSLVPPLAQLGLQAVYRLGLGGLLPVRLQAQRALARADLAAAIEADSMLRLRLRCLGRPLPERVVSVLNADNSRQTPQITPLTARSMISEELEFLQTFQN